MNLTERDRQLILTVSQYELITVCSVRSHKSTLQLMIQGLVK